MEYDEIILFKKNKKYFVTYEAYNIIIQKRVFGKFLIYCKDWNYKEIDWLNEFLFFNAKPIVYFINIPDKDNMR